MRLRELLIRRLLIWLGLWALFCVLVIFAMGKQDVKAEYNSASAFIDDLHQALTQAAPLGNIEFQRLRQQLSETKAEQERRETARELLLISPMLLLMAAGSGAVVWCSLRPALNIPLQQLVQWLNNYSTGDRSHASRTPLSTPPVQFRIDELKSIHDSVSQLIDTLEKEQQKSSKLLKHATDVQEKERQTIAQDLHDYFGQSLTSISVNSAFLMKSTSSHTQEAAKAVHDQAQEMMGWLRNSLRELKPHLLLDVSLRDAALDLIDNWARRHGWYVDFAWNPDTPALHGEAPIAIYRSLQEALTNAARHAKTKNMKILAGLDPANGGFILIVENDGATTKSPISPSLGLTGIRERISSIHGRVNWKIVDQSFILTCHVPLSGEHHAA